MSKYLTIQEVEEAIGEKSEAWKGRCFEISSRIVDAGLVPGGKAVYGHYRGPIHPGSHFGNVAHVGWAQHGWIVTDQGDIIDPTRWVFEKAKPYIHQFQPDFCEDFDPDDDGFVCRSCDHVFEEHESGKFFNRCKFSGLDYDEGGNQLREELMEDKPWPQSLERDQPLSLSGDCWNHLARLTGDDTLQWTGEPDLYGELKALSIQQLFWIGNCPLSYLGIYDHEIYQAFKVSGHDGILPLDNRRKVLQDC